MDLIHAFQNFPDSNAVQKISARLKGKEYGALIDALRFLEGDEKQEIIVALEQSHFRIWREHCKKILPCNKRISQGKEEDDADKVKSAEEDKALINERMTTISRGEVVEQFRKNCPKEAAIYDSYKEEWQRKHIWSSELLAHL